MLKELLEDKVIGDKVVLQFTTTKRGNHVFKVNAALFNCFNILDKMGNVLEPIFSNSDFKIYALKAGCFVHFKSLEKEYLLQLFKVVRETDEYGKIQELDYRLIHYIGIFNILNIKEQIWERDVIRRISSNL
jgi:hypothetical protein